MKKSYHQFNRFYLYLLIGVGAMILVGCEPPFDAFNDVNKFRVLSIKAEPPALTQGQMAVVTPLIYSDDDEAITYKWSWCPIATSAKEGLNCVVDEATLETMAEQLVREKAGDGITDTLPDFDGFSFDLGTGPKARFIYAMPADLLASVCEMIITDEIPSFTGIPNCESSLDVVIRLEATKGNETILATKKIPLFIDASRATNTNPEILGIEVFDDRGAVVSTDAPLKRQTWYDIVADISESTIDSFVPLPTEEVPNPIPRQESLFMTWYVTGGETDAMRTTYIEDEVSLDVLRKNSWRVPGRSELDGDVLQLFLVLQDEQGGTTWLERTFTIEES